MLPPADFPATDPTKPEIPLWATIGAWPAYEGCQAISNMALPRRLGCRRDPMAISRSHGLVDTSPDLAAAYRYHRDRRRTVPDGSASSHKSIFSGVGRSSLAQESWLIADNSRQGARSVRFVASPRCAARLRMFLNGRRFFLARELFRISAARALLRRHARTRATCSQAYACKSTPLPISYACAHSMSESSQMNRLW